MSRQALEAVIGRAVMETEFRMALFADPDATLAGYDLDPVELAMLKSVDAESLDALARGPGSRVVKLLHIDSPSVTPSLN